MKIKDIVIVIDRRSDNSQSPAIIRGNGEFPDTYNITVFPNGGAHVLVANNVRIGDETTNIRNGERFVILKEEPAELPDEESAEPAKKRGRPAKVEAD